MSEAMPTRSSSVPNGRSSRHAPATTQALPETVPVWETHETVSRTVVVPNAEGLHLRAATQFVQLAARFDAEFVVATDSSTANGGSMMELLTLGAYCGKELTITGTGAEAASGVDALCDLIANGFRPT